jgi:hypothetical protein
MDARTRERLPVMPALAAAVEQNRKDAAARLEAGRAAPPGELFTAGGQTLRRTRTISPSHRTWAEDPGGGKRRDLGNEEDNAFWAWAAIKILTHTGIRLEELTPRRGGHRLAPGEHRHPGHRTADRPREKW